MKKVLVALTALAVLTVAIPAGAEEQVCRTATIEHDVESGTPIITSSSGSTDGAIRTGIIGHFFVAQIGDDEATQESFDVSDPALATATACTDGVTITFSATFDGGSADYIPARVPDTDELTETWDYGNGHCLQTDGQVGVWNGTTADDEGCITESEYVEMYGTEALEQVVAANPAEEPDNPTVEEILFSFTIYNDPFELAALIGFTIE